jgi:hypothetical protein
MTACWIDGSEPRQRRKRGGTREGRGSFLALQQAQAGFKALEIMVTHDFVTALGGRRLMSPTARMNRLKRGGGIPVDRMSPSDALFERRFRRMIVSVVRKWPCQSTREAGRVINVAMGFVGAESLTLRGGSLTPAFPSTNRCWRLRVVTDDKIRCYGRLSTRFRRRVRRPKREAASVGAPFAARKPKGRGDYQAFLMGYSYSCTPVLTGPTDVSFDMCLYRRTLST